MSENRRRRPQQPVQPVAAPRKKKKHNKSLKGYLTILAMMAIVATISIGGTLAWLQADTDEIINTFVDSDIAVTLTESGTSDGTTDGTKVKNYKLIPGVNLPKDPKVTVTGDVDCYVFVKVTEDEEWPDAKTKDNSKRLVDYSIASEWTLVEGTTDVYSKTLTGTELSAAGETGLTYKVLVGEGEGDFKDGMVTVSSEITKAQMDEFADSIDLSFKAYVIQKAGFDTPALAWEEAQK